MKNRSVFTVVAVCASLFAAAPAFAGGQCPQTKSEAAARQWLQSLFDDAFSKSATDATYRKYFHEKYVQRADGVTLDYAGAVQHFGVVKNEVKSIAVKYGPVVVSGDQIADQHFVLADMNDGTHAEFEVIAIARLQDCRIVQLDELTFQHKGKAEAADLGSRK